MSQTEHTRFAEILWDWYAAHKRELPWRDLQIADDTQRAYQVLVSEIMLQQTQVPRVIGKYREFLDLFPTLPDLAAASNGQVIMAWRGLGYNNRALRLRDTAVAVMTEHGGVFPSDMVDLLALPGLGQYTAAAVRNFAFHLPTPCLDTNIRRIIHRAFFGPERSDGTWPHPDRELLPVAAELLKAALNVRGLHHDTANWHAALMDFGSIVCTKGNPKWDLCPLTRAGLMTAAYKELLPAVVRAKPAKQEPGRFVGSSYVPNRIFRGRIVEALRDHEAGLAPDAIGRHVCLDWSPADHERWLDGILKSLVADRLVRQQGKKFRLVA